MDIPIVKNGKKVQVEKIPEQHKDDESLKTKVKAHREILNILM